MEQKYIDCGVSQQSNSNWVSMRHRAVLVLHSGLHKYCSKYPIITFFWHFIRRKWDMRIVCTTVTWCHIDTRIGCEKNNAVGQFLFHELLWIFSSISIYSGSCPLTVYETGKKSESDTIANNLFNNCFLLNKPSWWIWNDDRTIIVWFKRNDHPIDAGLPQPYARNRRHVPTMNRNCCSCDMFSVCHWWWRCPNPIQSLQIVSPHLGEINKINSHWTSQLKLDWFFKSYRVLALTPEHYRNPYRLIDLLFLLLPVVGYVLDA